MSVKMPESESEIVTRLILAEQGIANLKKDLAENTGLVRELVKESERRQASQRTLMAVVGMLGAAVGWVFTMLANHLPWPR